MSSSNNTKQNLQPKLRFPEFRDAGGWETDILDNVIKTVIPPVKIQTTAYSFTGRFPVIDQSAYEIAGWTDDENAIIRANLPLIIFGDHTCNLKITHCPFAQGADGIKIFYGTEKLRTEYLFQYLQYSPVRMEEYKRHFSILKTKRIMFPNNRSGEQQKIANCLSSLDDVIAAEGEKLEALRQHKKGLMQELFPAEGETLPKLRFPEFRDVGGWEEKPLWKICDVLQGYGFPEVLQGGCSGKYPFCKVSDISKAVADKGGDLDMAANYIGDDELLKLRAKLIPIGATVFAKIGEALRLNRRALVKKECLIDNNAIGLKAIRGIAEDYFVYLLSQKIDLNEHCGGAVPSVNKSTLQEIMVTVPNNPKEQKHIADCLSSLDTLITAQGQKLETLRQHKKGLMQQLFPSPEDVEA
jgi:type I restriction enzyme S subunit